MKCKHCGKEIEQLPTLPEWLSWRHKDGFYNCFYNCDGRRGHAATYAEPVEEVVHEPQSSS